MEKLKIIGLNETKFKNFVFLSLKVIFLNIKIIYIRENCKKEKIANQRKFGENLLEKIANHCKEVSETFDIHSH